MFARRPVRWPWQPRNLLAMLLAVVLAVGPFAHASLPRDAAAAAAIADSLAAQDGDEAGPLKLNLGIPARATSLEATLALAVAKAPEFRATIDGPWRTRCAALARISENCARFQRSAVGTARTPTGPPA